MKGHCFRLEPRSPGLSAIDCREQGALCYIDAYTEPDATGTLRTSTGETKELDRLRDTPLHLCRR